MPGDGTHCTFTIRSTIFLGELQLESRATAAPARLLRFAFATQLTAQQLRSSVSSCSSRVELGVVWALLELAGWLAGLLQLKLKLNPKLVSATCELAYRESPSLSLCPTLSGDLSVCVCVFFGLTNWMAFFQLALEQLVYVLIGQKLL